MNRQEALHWLHQQLTWERRLAELRWLHAMKSARRAGRGRTRRRLTASDHTVVSAAGSSADDAAVSRVSFA